jgi:hypothetical protein
MAKAKPDYIDVDKDGNKKEPMKKAVKDAKAKKHVKKKAHGKTKMKSHKSKKKTHKLKESHLIVQFLQYLAEKNYSEANKYLKGLVELKIKNKMAQHINQNIF